MNTNAYSKTIITDNLTGIDELKKLLSEKNSTESLNLAIEMAALIVFTKLGEEDDFTEVEIIE